MTMIAIAAGAVIGGWLAESPYWYSLTGPGAAFIFLGLAVLLVPVGLAFAEMGCFAAVFIFRRSLDSQCDKS